MSIAAGLAPKQIERVLDSHAWRGMEALHRALRTARARRSRGPARAVGAAQAVGLAHLVGILETAIAAGDVDLATDVADRALACVEGGEPRLAARAIAAVIDLWLTVGERDRARALALDHRTLLERTSRGAATLDVLRLRDSPPLWHDDGKPNTLAIARSVETGSLDRDALLAELFRHPRQWLQHPQLHLLDFHACLEHQPQRAGRALSRFYRAHGLGGASLSGRSENILADVVFDSRSHAVDGPLVSIAVSAFDAETTIGYSIGSLLAQTYRRIEVLVCDDGSTDGTLATIRARFGDDPRVRIFRSLANQGTYNVRNALFDTARGAFLTSHDADDLAHPELIARQVASIRSERASGSVTNMFRITPRGRVVVFRDQNTVRLAMVTLMMTADAWRAVRPYRSARFGADLELYEELRARSRVARLKLPLLMGLWSERSVTRTSGAQALEDGFRSASRRAYSQMLTHKSRDGVDRATLDAKLRELGNYIAPRGVEELGA